MRFLAIILTLTCTACHALDITTTKGTTYTNATVTRIEPDGITIKHRLGITKLFFSELPQDVQTSYGYNPSTARTYNNKAAEQQRQFKARQTAALKNQEKQLEEAQTAEEVKIPLKGVTIEQMNLFPEKYVDHRFIFSHCEISQKLDKPSAPNEYYGLTVKSPGGQYVFSHSRELSFVVSKAIAEQMATKLEGGYVWTDCTIYGIVTKKPDGDQHIGVVDRIDIYNQGGNISRTFK
jgi:hypothetical protein